MAIKNRLLYKLVCPSCKGKLKYDHEFLECIKCDRRYNLIAGFPNFLPDQLLDIYNPKERKQNLYNEKEYYEKLYSNMDGLDDGHCVVYGHDKLYDFMYDIPSGTLLDVGCGSGHHSKNLSLKGYEVTGIDVSVNGLIQARKISEAYNQDIDFVLGDIENLPFADHSYDVVFCSLILHHFPKRARVLSEISRVCKSFFVTFEVNSYDPISFVRFNVLNPTIGIHNISRNQRAISPVRLEKELRNLSFQDFECEFVNIHHYTGREPNSLRSKLLSISDNALKFFPYKCRFNKFMMKCEKRKYLKHPD